jgi:hypothetical protein
MPELNTLVTKSAKVIHREMPDGEAKRLPEGFDKPADGDWVCMSAEVPADDESAGDIVRVAGLNTNRHSSKSPIKLLGLHMRGTMDGAPAVIGRMEEFRLGKKSWKGKQVPAMFGRFSWAKDGEGKVTELAGKYKALWDGGYLDSVSIGFRPIKSRSLNAEKPWDGYEFIESELVELSIVTIPANPAATVLRTIADTFETKEEKTAEVSVRLDAEDFKGVSEELIKHIDKLHKQTEKRLDDLESAIVAAPHAPEQAGDNDQATEKQITSDEVLSYLKSRL